MSPRHLSARHYLAAALWLTAWVWGCTVEEVDLTGKACPCADGYVCDSTTQSCRKAGASGGSASGGAAGSSGAGGAATGGTNTGGTGGASTGGTGGTSTGGTGGTSTGGTGGTSTGGISCGNGSCTVTAQTCCHADDGTSAAGSCIASGSTCPAGFVNMFCDEPADCGSGKVCCERLSLAGNLNSVQCEPSAAECKALGSGTASLLCNPSSPGCPGGMVCAKTSRGYSRCE